MILKIWSSCNEVMQKILFSFKCIKSIKIFFTEKEENREAHASQAITDLSLGMSKHWQKQDITPPRAFPEIIEL